MPPPLRPPFFSHSCRYSSDIGTVTCSTCEPGKYSDSSRIMCNSCTAGKSSNPPDSNDCTQCPTGMYSPFSTSPVCEYCEAGKQVENAQTGCEDCDPGYT